MKIKLTLSLIALFIYVNVSIGQSKVSMNVEHATLGNDTFYFQKTQYNSLNLGFSDNVSSFYIGRNAGKDCAANWNIGIGGSTLTMHGGGGNIAIGEEAMSQGIGSNNIAIGLSSLKVNEGSDNIGIGDQSLMRNQTGNQNIAIGANALEVSASGSSNIAIGSNAMMLSDGSSDNVAIGRDAMAENDASSSNIAIGSLALSANTSASENIAIGTTSLASNTTGTKNTSVGHSALRFGEGGLENTGIGFEALRGTAGQNHAYNTAIGSKAAYSISRGIANVAVGAYSLFANSLGNDNVAIGLNALKENTSNENIAIGSSALARNTGGSSNTAVGRSAGLLNINGSGNIFIGYSAGSGELGSNKLYIGSTPIIYGDLATDLLRFNTNSVEIANDNEPSLFLNRTGSGRFDFEMSMEGADLVFKGGGNGTASLSTKLRIDDTGDVGIGPDDPEHRLDVDGDVSVRALTTTGTLLTLEKMDGTDILDIQTGLTPEATLAGKMTITSPIQGVEFPDSEQAILLNNTLFANSSGQIRIGSFTTSTRTPMSDIHIKQSVNSNSDPDYSPGIRLEARNSTNHWTTYLDSGNDYAFLYNNTLKSYIRDSDGSYVTTSDRRLKNNITHLSSALVKINQLKPAQYSYNSDPSRSISYGFIAQELQKVYPGMVSENNGNLGIAYDHLIPVAIKGIQELSAENENLKKELNSLKQEMAEIKALLKKSR